MKDAEAAPVPLLLLQTQGYTKMWQFRSSLRIWWEDVWTCKNDQMK